jgi:hypothetical protein
MDPPWTSHLENARNEGDIPFARSFHTEVALMRELAVECEPRTAALLSLTGRFSPVAIYWPSSCSHETELDSGLTEMAGAQH